MRLFCKCGPLHLFVDARLQCERRRPGGVCEGTCCPPKKVCKTNDECSEQKNSELSWWSAVHVRYCIVPYWRACGGRTKQCMSKISHCANVYISIQMQSDSISSPDGGRQLHHTCASRHLLFILLHSEMPVFQKFLTFHKIFTTKKHPGFSGSLPLTKTKDFKPQREW